MSTRRRALLQNEASTPFEPVFPVDDYVKLEYLHFSGTPKFDTGVTCYNDDLTPRGYKLVFKVDTTANITKDVSFIQLYPAFNQSWYYWLYVKKNTYYLSSLEGTHSTMVVQPGVKHTIIGSRKNKTISFDNITESDAHYNAMTTHGDGSLPTVSLGNYLGWGADSNYNVYEFQVLDENDRPVSWFQPAMRLSDHKLGFWDYVQETFRVNSKGGTITYGLGDLQLLSSIEWTGNEVGFQTGVFYDNSRYIGWDIDFEYTVAPSSRSDLLVCMGGSNFCGIQRTNGGVFRNQYNGSYYEPTISANTAYNIKTSPNGEVFVNGTQVSTITPLKGYQSYFVLGGWNQGSNTTIQQSRFTLNKCKVKRLRLIDDNGYIIYWLPATNINTNKIGYYDVISGNFITPQGSLSHLTGNTI